MSVDFRMPKIDGATEGEQLSQIKSYLYQHVSQLQWALKNIDTTTVVVPPTLPKSLSPSSEVVAKGDDYVDEEGSYDTENGSWAYKKWYGGTFDLSGTFNVIPKSAGTIGTVEINYSEQIQIELPFPVETIQCAGASAEQYYLFSNATLVSKGDEENNAKIGFSLMSFTDFDTDELSVHLLASGRWK
jgi:hypothetical protein